MSGNDVVLPATGAVVETVDQGGSGTTNATTASGNNTLHFASTPAFVSVGMGISDSTAPTAIPAGTTVLSFTGTTVVMSGNAAGSGVGSGDTIVFTAQRQVVHLGSLTACSRSRTIIPNNTTAIVVKAAPGTVYKIRATNNSDTIAYIHLYDAASATAGAGTPVDTIMIPASADGGAGIDDDIWIGAIHANGIAFTVTTGIADTDTGVPAAGTYVVTVFYK